MKSIIIMAFIIIFFQCLLMYYFSETVISSMTDIKDIIDTAIPLACFIAINGIIYEMRCV